LFFLQEQIKDITRPRPIQSQRHLTQQLTKEWPQYKALHQRFAGTRFEEHHQLHLPQKHKATVPDSTLSIEMNGLEEQADLAQAINLYWKPLSWLGTIRPTSSNDAGDAVVDYVCLHNTRFVDFK
jgi:hypothetical protein